jgi:chloride channel 3/4/5
LALPMHGHSIQSLQDQLALLAELRITGFPIVTTMSERFIVGYINRSELYTALTVALRNPSNTPNTRCYFAMLSLRFPRGDPYVDLRPWLHPSPVQVVEHTPLYRVHDLFRKLGLRYVLVTNFGRLTGILTKKDILFMIQQSNEKKREAEGGKGTVNETIQGHYMMLTH